MAKPRGELEDRTTVNVLVTSPEWVTLRDRIIAALVPHPQAKTAVLAPLKRNHMASLLTEDMRRALAEAPPTWNEVASAYKQTLLGLELVEAFRADIQHAAATRRRPENSGRATSLRSLGAIAELELYEIRG